MDFRKVESKRPTHISFTVAVSGGSSEKTYSFRPHLDPSDPSKEALMIDDILISLAAAVRRIYPGNMAILSVEHPENLTQSHNCNCGSTFPLMIFHLRCTS